MTVPPEDRFTPFAHQIRAGDSVRWVNNDSDDHTVVSDDALNTAGPSGDQLIPAIGGGVSLRFNRPGTFVYYCRFRGAGQLQPAALLVRTAASRTPTATSARR